MSISIQSKKKKEKKKKDHKPKYGLKIFEEVLLSFNSSLVNERKKTKQKIKTK